MNRQQFSELVRNPGTLGSESVVELEALLRQYPYFSSAQLLLALCLLQQNNPNYPAQFKKAVAYAGDRKRLKVLLECRQTEVGAKSLSLEANPLQEDLTKPVRPDAPVPVQPVSEENLIVEVSETPALSPEIPVVPVKQEPRQENFIEESVITEDELALASPEPTIKEIPEPVVVRTLYTVPRQKEISKEKLSQEDLLAIVRKRLAEINSEKSGFAPGKEPDERLTLSQSAISPGVQVSKESKSKDELIEKFIREEPQISRPKKEFFNPTSSSQKSNLDEEDIVSETLALLYAKQGNMQKAIHIYEKLSLRFSEKSRYFAAQIENLKGNTQQAE